MGNFKPNFQHLAHMRVADSCWHSSCLVTPNEENDFDNVVLGVLVRVDQLAGSKQARSLVIERAIRSYLRQQDSAVAEIADLELINDAADRLNIEAEDVLEYV